MGNLAADWRKDLLYLATTMLKHVLLIAILMAQMVFAQQKVAILGTEDDGEPPLKHTELSTLTAKLRYIATETLPDNYEIMTEQSIVSFLGSQKEVEKVCKAADGCLAKIGRDIEADYIGQARVSRFGKFFSVKVEVYDVKKGTLISSFVDDSSDDIYALSRVIEQKAPDMFKKIAAKVSVPPVESKPQPSVKVVEPLPPPVKEIEQPAVAPTVAEVREEESHEDDGKRRKMSYSLSLYRSSYINDNKYYREDRSGLTAVLGFEIELFADYLFFGIFGGGGRLGDDMPEVIGGIDIKKLFWITEGTLALPISLAFALRSGYSGAFMIVPTVDLQYFLDKNFSFYGGYMYRINVAEGGYYLGNERIFGIIPGTLRFGINLHTGDFL